MGEKSIQGIAVAHPWSQKDTKEAKAQRAGEGRAYDEMEEVKSNSARTEKP